MHKTIRYCLLLPLLPALAGAPVLAQEDIDAVEVSIGARDPIRLRRFGHEEAAIDLDGRITEEAWLQTRAHSSLRVVEPDTLDEPRYRTDIRLFYTERGLYVSFDMEQPADTLLQRYTARDDGRTQRDRVSFTLDTSGGGRYGYWMSVALGDNQLDGTILPERQYSREWDGAWYAATTETDKGWSAEYFIPWSQMAMPKEDRIRRFGFYGSRDVGYLNEKWAWPALPNSLPRFMSLLQPLEVEGIDPRQQWSVFPYASSTVDQVVDTMTWKAGADIFWRPTSNFQLTATLNPDFGSVESDDVDVNLTANETFFPEKRLFFQEGAEIFDATPRATERGGGGGGRDRFTVINTRRIGGRPRDVVLPDGVDLPDREALKLAELYGALKATGQIAGFRYGVLGASEQETQFRADDGETYTQTGRDFGAVRVLYEDSLGAAYRGLGFVSTLVAHEESNALVHAGDFHYLSTSGAFNVDGQVLYTDVDDTGEGKGAYADLTYQPRQGLKHDLKLTYFDDALEVNDFGFSQRNNLRDLRYNFEWIRSGLKRVRNTRLNAFYRYGENTTEGRQVLGGVGGGYEITFNNLHFLNVSAAFFPARYDDRNSFGNGTFAINDRGRVSLEYKTNEADVFSLSGQVEYQIEDIEGRRIELTGGIGWRPISNINLEIETRYTDRDGWLLHQQDRNFTSFVAEQWQPKISFDYFINADHQLRFALQWIGIRAIEDRFYTLPDDSTELVEGPKPPGDPDSFSISQLNLQLRYRWQIAPLSDLFVVYTKADRHRTDPISFKALFEQSWDDPLGDALVIKLRYRLGS